MKFHVLERVNDSSESSIQNNYLFGSKRSLTSSYSDWKVILERESRYLSVVINRVSRLLVNREGLMC